MRPYPMEKHHQVASYHPQQFPFALLQPNDPTAHQLWPQNVLSRHDHLLDQLEAVLKLIPDVTHVRHFVMLSVAEASFPPELVRDSSTPLRSAQNDSAIAHR